MGLTKKRYPGSKATQEWTTRTNPLGLENDNGAGGPPSAKEAACLQEKPPTEGKQHPEVPDAGIPDAKAGDMSCQSLFPKDVIRTIRGRTTRLNLEKQMRHIPGSPYYQEGKSILTISLQEVQELVNQSAGTGQFLNPDFTKERVDFGKPIGIHVDPDNGIRQPTTIALIHYSKSGTHIVPAEPREK